MHTSDEEQLEAIKKWWQENGVAVMVGLVVGLGGLFGWQAWQSHIETRAENASTVYTQLTNALNQPDSQSAPALVDTLLNEFDATPYAPLAALAAAKAAVDAGDIETARTRLQWVVDNGGRSEYVPLARLRLARLYITGGELDKAEQLLNAGGYGDSYAARRSELRGDLYAARGELSAARASYDSALNAELPVQNRQMIQIKRDALHAVDAAAEAGEAPADA